MVAVIFGVCNSDPAELRSEVRRPQGITARGPRFRYITTGRSSARIVLCSRELHNRIQKDFSKGSTIFHLTWRYCVD